MSTQIKTVSIIKSLTSLTNHKPVYFLYFPRLQALTPAVVQKKRANKLMLFSTTEHTVRSLETKDFQELTFYFLVMEECLFRACLDIGLVFILKNFRKINQAFELFGIL